MLSSDLALGKTLQIIKPRLYGSKKISIPQTLLKGYWKFGGGGVRSQKPKFLKEY